MKKITLVCSLLFCITVSACASDYLEPQVSVYNSSYEHRNIQPRSERLTPVTVYTGSTVIVQDHYDVYQPVVTYHKVNTVTNTSVCKVCK